MPVTPPENIVFLEGVLAKAKLGAAAAATAMARFIAERTANDTLRRTSHPSGEWHRARPGEPPAMASGNLADSMFFVPASGGLRASSLVGNSAEYSRILEFGHDLAPPTKHFMHWVDSGGSWYHTFLRVPPHPYLEPTVEESIDDGSLREAAIEAFRPYDP